MWLMVITVRKRRWRKWWKWWWWWWIGGNGSLAAEVQEAAAEMHPEHTSSCWKPARRRGEEREELEKGGEGGRG